MNLTNLIFSVTTSYYILDVVIPLLKESTPLIILNIRLIFSY